MRHTHPEQPGPSHMTHRIFQEMIEKITQVALKRAEVTGRLKMKRGKTKKVTRLKKRQRCYLSLAAIVYQR